MSVALTLQAPAKVNLSLRVLAREESGFHQLETLFLAIDLADELRLERAGTGVELHVEGDAPADPRHNLAGRAALRFLEAAGIGEGVRISLRKRIPAGAGLGGGSSDAGAVLRGLAQLFDHPLAAGELIAIAAELGSDVPFFAAGVPFALGWGRGERLVALPAPPAAPLLVALPAFPSPTPAAYAALAEARAASPRAPAGRILTVDQLSRWDTLAALACNDFEQALLPRHPALADILTGLRSTGARLALLAGSGSAAFAVYPDEGARAAALAALASRLPARLVAARSLTRVGGG
ncbi:MAG TPA: 4-(cytidine 5'-diphospho)-2-C-methyl-D-erythritol kinase [Longimicrobiales bacterium]|nr:4-(cytidine 5'-diphospho)-2-C-methyl-D-erythritol kinase [Longimicrobiales bacterium]